MDDLCVCTDASGFHEPLAYGCGHVAASMPPGELGGIKAAGGVGAIGALFSVVGALDDVAADAG
ncbi:hypothetical protein [Streptomyces sp. CB01373]|uniref:hypothetical protein n=1 Tax=Streptomyces sp. CB01373 TaxID=2020325 RepID=UPI00131D7CD7|nr:hypothetical protein [Streptomyces sp. CB01373]